MELNPKFADTTLASFLDSWTPERVASMSLASYAHLEDHDSLCYWLEYGTKYLGAIGRISLNKFELWQIQNDKEFKDDRYKKHGGYAWNRNRGDYLDTAFENVRAMASEIVRLSQAGDWKAIEDIPFHAIGKWKLAFLFSRKQLLPVYSKRALLAITDGLGLSFNNNSPVYALQEAILALKPGTEDVIDYSYRLYDQYARGPVKPNFYIIGSKYSDANGNDTVSVMKEFLSSNSVAMGWVWGHDFSALIGEKNNEVNAWVAKYHKDAKPAMGKVKGYFRLFAQMRPGDIIAVKSHGSFSKLQIIGYAQVVERNGSVYFYDTNSLGHHINVEFLDASFVRSFNYNYAATIHQLTASKDGNAFYDIFNWYVENERPSVEEDPLIESEPDAGDNDESEEDGYNSKMEGSFQRGAIAGATVNLVHNRIQNRFLTYLKTTYPNHSCSGEKRYIDAKRITDKKCIIYEIKPFASVYTCIREGIGQLFDYMHRENTKKKKYIMIVGPGKPSKKDLQFIAEMKKLVNVPFGYLAFDEKNLKAVEY